MARAERRRTQRAKPDAGPGRQFQQSARVGTEDLFFSRLRAQAKWAFVFLALVFGVGFVAFGVGSDVQGGIADVVGIGRTAGTGPNADDARERLEKNPRDAEALRDLATALQTDGRPEEAADPLRRYVALRPRDEGALRELAGIYLARASRTRNDLQIAQLEAQALNPAGDFALPQTTPLGQALGTSAITQAITSGTNEEISRLYGQMQGAYAQAKAVYRRLARILPQDASLQLQLADAAQNSGDTRAAIAAYRRFLQLAPDDPSAPLVKLEIQRLQQASQAGTTVGSSG